MSTYILLQGWPCRIYIFSPSFFKFALLPLSTHIYYIGILYYYIIHPYYSTPSARGPGGSRLNRPDKCLPPPDHRFDIIVNVIIYNISLAMPCFFTSAAAPDACNKRLLRVRERELARASLGDKRVCRGRPVISRARAAIDSTSFFNIPPENDVQSWVRGNKNK